MELVIGLYLISGLPTSDHYKTTFVLWVPSQTPGNKHITFLTCTQKHMPWNDHIHEAQTYQ
jgi:hypothetical protein